MQTKMKHSGEENSRQTNDFDFGLHISGEGEDDPGAVRARYALTYVFMHERYRHRRATAEEFHPWVSSPLLWFVHSRF